MDIIYSKCHNGVIIVPRFADVLCNFLVIIEYLHLHAAAYHWHDDTDMTRIPADTCRNMSYFKFNLKLRFNICEGLRRLPLRLPVSGTGRAAVRVRVTVPVSGLQPESTSGTPSSSSSAALAP
jgi:hypothetical protein